MREKRALPSTSNIESATKKTRVAVRRVAGTPNYRVSSDSSDGDFSSGTVKPQPTTSRANTGKKKVVSTSTSTSKGRPSSKPRATAPKAAKVAGQAPRRRPVPKTGLPQLPPAPSQLHGRLDFSTQAHKLQFKKLEKLCIVPCKLLELSVLPTLDVMPTVSEYMHAIGWEKLLDYRYPIYFELVQEFYATFSCSIPADCTAVTPVVKFRLLGKPFHMSFIQLNVALGLLDSVQDAPLLNGAVGGFVSKFEMDRHDFWRELAGDTSVKHNKTSKANCIVDPAFRIIQAWLGHSLSARPFGTNVVSKQELCLMWCMKNRNRADFARWLVKQFDSVVSYFDQTQQRGLSLGIYITRIAVHEGLLDMDDTNLHEIYRVEDMLMDTNFYLNTRIVRKKGAEIEFSPPSTTVSDASVSSGNVSEVYAYLDCLTKRVEALEQGQNRIIELLEKRASHSTTSDSPPPSTG